MGVRRVAYGVKLSWAYAPGEFKLLVSPDGANFGEAACWRSSSRDDASFAEHVMFEIPTPVRAVTVIMRLPRAWGYFGLRSLSLIAEPGPAMLVSGVTSPSGALCVVSASLHARVSLTPCLDAVANGIGHEVFLPSAGGALASATRPDHCLTLADGSAADGGQLVMSDCPAAAEVDDGRGAFEPTAPGQLKFSSMGNYCVSAAGGAGLRDVAASSRVYAPSSQSARPAENAVDGLGGSSTYWASAGDLSEKALVDLALDFGASVNIGAIDVEWEVAAKAWPRSASARSLPDSCCARLRYEW